MQSGYLALCRHADCAEPHRPDWTDGSCADKEKAPTERGQVYAVSLTEVLLNHV